MDVWDFNDFYSIKINTDWNYFLRKNIIWFKNESLKKIENWFDYRILIKIWSDELKIIWKSIFEMKWNIFFNEKWLIDNLNILIWDLYLITWSIDQISSNKLNIYIQNNNSKRYVLIDQRDINFEMFFSKILPKLNYEKNKKYNLSIFNNSLIENNILNEVQIEKIDDYNYKIYQNFLWINTQSQLEYDKSNNLVKYITPYIKYEKLIDKKQIENIIRQFSDQKIIKTKNWNTNLTWDVFTSLENETKNISQQTNLSQENYNFCKLMN